MLTVIASIAVVEQGSMKPQGNNPGQAHTPENMPSVHLATSISSGGEAPNLRIPSSEEIDAAHRLVLRDLHAVHNNIMYCLEWMATNAALKLADLMDKSGPDENGRWRQDKENEQFRKAISLSSRVHLAKEAALIFTKIVKMERDIYGIKPEQSKSTIDDLLLKIHAERNQLPVDGAQKKDSDGE